ncbi:hypothetical protein [Leeia sp.]|uniref:hypothetical protein n=1 Tax=Leeia sp. TaxID=2884678 RepID=UPI0035AE3487
MLKRSIVIGLSTLLLAQTSISAPYPAHDLSALLQAPKAGQPAHFDLARFDAIFSDLYPHAQNYPPSFDSPEDLARARQEYQQLSQMLDTLLQHPARDLLQRSALLHNMGAIMDVPGAAQRALQRYPQWIAADAANPLAHYSYGRFLADIGQADQARPVLEKAKTLGSEHAPFTLGLVYQQLGNTPQALTNLKAWQARHPNDKQVKQIIDAIEKGTLTFHFKPSASATTP